MLPLRGEYNSAVDRIDLAARIRSHAPGRALAREFYTDPSIFERDMERMLLRHWFMALTLDSRPAAAR